MYIERISYTLQQRKFFEESWERWGTYTHVAFHLSRDSSKLLGHRTEEERKKEKEAAEE